MQLRVIKNQQTTQIKWFSSLKFMKNGVVVNNMFDYNNYLIMINLYNDSTCLQSQAQIMLS